MSTSPSADDLAQAYRGEVVWISGARGFIGSRLSHRLRAAGARVHDFAGDVRDAEDLRRSVHEAAARCCFHLAAPVNVRRDDALIPLMRDVIAGGTLKLLAALRSCDASQPRLVHVGSCEEYGEIEAPFAEHDQPSAPASPYARFKLEATRAVLAAEDLDACVVRPFLTYGPGQRSGALVPAAIDAALRQRPFLMTEGEQSRELNHVDDTVDGLLRAGSSPRARGQLINLCGGEELRVRDIAARIFRLCDAPSSLLRLGALPTRGGEVPRFCGSTERCVALLGHRPRISLDEGLRRTIAWAREGLR